MPNHQETAKDLMERFPGWRAWLGTQTQTWWAIAPAELRLSQLLQSPTSGGLAVQIAQHQKPATLAENRSPEQVQARFCWRVDEDPQPVRLARRMVDNSLAAWNAEHWLDNGRTIASELVTNAGRHASPPIFLALSIEHDPETSRSAFVVEVSDASTTPPTNREPGDDGGFGMTILHSLAKVTIHIYPGGKTIRAAIPEPLRR